MAETFFLAETFYGRDFLRWRISMAETFRQKRFSLISHADKQTCQDEVSNYLHLYSLSYQTNFIMKFVLMDHPSVWINKAIKTNY
jgi:hypothetical protein